MVWATRDAPPRPGELIFGPGYLAIDDRTRTGPGAWLAAEQVLSVRDAGATERLRGLPALALDTDNEMLLVAPFETERLARVAELLHAFAAFERPARPLRLIVAGAGVAGLEAGLAVRELAGERVATTLLSPERCFTYRPLLVTEPFGEPAPRISLERIARDLGAELRLDALTAVDTDKGLVITSSGLDLPYDVLLIALGARMRPALPGALTFGLGATTSDLAALIEEIGQGRVESVAFVAPEGTVWTLPLYELALLTARRATGATRAAITVVTGEREPLGLLGAQASRVVADLLDDQGVRVLAGRVAVRVEPDCLVVDRGERLRADRVVALPRLEGSRVPGLPHDHGGYLPTDRFGHVGALPTVLAAGDATSFPIKQGGIAAQQAEIAASVVAARAGTTVVPAPFDPVVEAQLLTGAAPLYIRSKLEIGRGESSSVSIEPVRRTPGKIAAPRLSRYLAGCLAPP